MSVYADLLRYRELFGSLFRRDLQARYKGTIFGVAWSLVNPIMLAAIYVLVFSLLWEVTSIDHYPLFLLCGLSVWLFVSSSLTGAARSMLDYAELIKKVRFPRQLVAFSVVATQLVPFVVLLGGLIVVNAIVLERTRDTVLLAIPVAAGIVVLVGRHGAGGRVRERRLPRRGAPAGGAAAAVVLPDADPLLARRAARRPGGLRHRGRPAALGEPADAAALCASRSSLLRRGACRGDVLYLAVAAVVSLAVGAFVFTRVDDRIAVEL